VSHTLTHCFVRVGAERRGPGGRCNFEQGRCSWTGSQWTWQRASEAWPHHGPPRDHTLNSNAGKSPTMGPFSLSFVMYFQINDIHYFLQCFFLMYFVVYLNALFFGFNSPSKHDFSIHPVKTNIVLIKGVFHFGIICDPESTEWNRQSLPPRLVLWHINIKRMHY